MPIRRVRGATYLVDERLDAAAARLQEAAGVPQAARAAREARDGPHFHVTLFTKAEGARERAEDAVQDDWWVIGAGEVAGGGVFVAPVVWPSAAAARTRLGLPPADFHVTLGFLGADRHGVAKDERCVTTPTAEAGVAAQLLRAAQAELRSTAVGAPARALTALDGALVLVDADAELRGRLLLARAMAHHKAGDAAAMLADAEEVAAAFPGWAAAHARRGAALVQMEQLVEAELAFAEGAECLAGLDDSSGEFQGATERDRRAIARGLETVRRRLAEPATPETDDLDVRHDTRVRHPVTLDDGRSVRLPRNWSWVVRGQLAGVSIPGERDHILALRKMGVTLLVTLFDHPLPAAWFEGTGVDNVFLEVENFGAPAVEDLAAAVARMRAAVEAGGACAAHCGGGKGRAGTMLACYLLRHGVDAWPAADVPAGAAMSAADVIARLRYSRPGSIESTLQEERIGAFANWCWQEPLPPKPADKYPSTPHLPFSPSVHSDDVQLDAADAAGLFAPGVPVVITEKLDGGNCCLVGGRVFARTHGKEATHASFGPVKTLYTELQHKPAFDPGLALFGENMFAVHSLEYDALASFFYLFGVKRLATGEWLSWDEVEAVAAALGVPTAPVLFRGEFGSMGEVRQWMEQRAGSRSAVGSCESEGFVLRVARGFADADFERSMAKFVRANHVQTGEAWTRTWKKARLVRSSSSSSSSSDDDVADWPAEIARLQAVVAREPPESELEQLRRSWRPPAEGKAPDVDPAARADEEEALEAVFGCVATTDEAGCRLLRVPLDGGAELRVWIPADSAYPAEAPLARLAPAERVSPAAQRLLDGCVARAARQAARRGEVFVHELAEAAPGWLGRLDEACRAAPSPSQSQEAQPAAPSQEAQPPAPEQPKKPSKAKKTKKTSTRRNGLPNVRFLMLVGLPGSGKSTFSQQLVATAPAGHGNAWARVSQDDVGSRAECERLVGREAARNGARVVLDRCNVQAAERREWLALAMARPAASAAVFFDAPAAACKARVAARPDHPTIPAGRGARIVDGFAKRLQPPAAAEGFGAGVFTVSSPEDANALLRRFGALPLPAAAFAEPEPPADRGLFKFPRTRHLYDLGGSGVTRDDLVLDDGEARAFLGVPLALEEKVDGANLGISLTGDYQVVLQVRGRRPDLRMAVGGAQPLRR